MHNNIQGSQPGLDVFIYRSKKLMFIFGPLENEFEELRERSGVFNCLQQFLKDQVDIKKQATNATPEKVQT